MQKLKKRFGINMINGEKMKMMLGLIELMRPLEWSKSFGNALIGMLLAFYVGLATISITTFIIGTIGIILLWSGLYALNDYTDREADAKHKAKKLRPIPSGKVPPKIALLFSLVLIITPFFISLYLNNPLYALCLIFMLINQLLYTLKPFSLKKRPIVDFISGSMINPSFRYLTGWVLFVPTFNAPILGFIFIIGIQLGGYMLYRIHSKDHDKKHGYKSSVVLFPEKIIKNTAYGVLIISLLSFSIILLQGITLHFGIYEENLLRLGFLPIQYSIVLLIALYYLPKLINPMKNPEKTKLNPIYRVTYSMNLIFIIVLLIVFLISKTQFII